MLKYFILSPSFFPFSPFCSYPLLNLRFWNRLFQVAFLGKALLQENEAAKQGFLNCLSCIHVYWNCYLPWIGAATEKMFLCVFVWFDGPDPDFSYIIFNSLALYLCLLQLLTHLHGIRLGYLRDCQSPITSTILLVCILQKLCRYSYIPSWTSPASRNHLLNPWLLPLAKAFERCLTIPQDSSRLCFLHEQL